MCVPLCECYLYHIKLAKFYNTYDSQITYEPKRRQKHSFITLKIFISVGRDAVIIRKLNRVITLPKIFRSILGMFTASKNIKYHVTVIHTS